MWVLKVVHVDLSSFVGFATIGVAQDVASFSRNFSMMSCILTHMRTCPSFVGIATL